MTFNPDLVLRDGVDGTGVGADLVTVDKILSLSDIFLFCGESNNNYQKTLVGLFEDLAGVLVALLLP